MRTRYRSSSIEQYRLYAPLCLGEERLGGALPLFGIQPLHTCRADAMRKVGLRMFADITFNVVPVSLVVANIFADRAYWNQTFKSLDLAECFLKFQNQFFSVQLRPSPFRDNGCKRHGTHCDRPHKCLDEEQRFVLRLADEWTKPEKRAPDGDA